MASLFDEHVSESEDGGNNSIALDILISKFPHVPKEEVRDILAGCSYDDVVAEVSITQMYGAKR